MVVQICVLGAGIIGISSAYRLCLNYPGCEMTVYHDGNDTDTTSYHGFGMVTVQVNGSKFESMRDVSWAIETFNFCEEISNKSKDLAGEMGIESVDGIRFVDNTNVNGEYKDRLCIWESKLLQEKCAGNFRKCSDEEMAPYRSRYKAFDAAFERTGVLPGDIDGYAFKSFIIDGPRYIPWLKSQMREMEQRGFISKFEYKQRRILSFSELKDCCDVIINCTGLGAGSLCNDENVRPIKAQYIMLEDSITPNKNTFYYGAHTFTCPKSDCTLLGSVFLQGRSDDVIEEKHTASLLERNAAFFPSSKDAKIKAVRTAVRPARIGGPRVELDWVKLPPNGASTELPVVHNYGHAAKGFMLHWGCATEVVRLCKTVVNTSSKY